MLPFTSLRGANRASLVPQPETKRSYGKSNLFLPLVLSVMLQIRHLGLRDKWKFTFLGRFWVCDSLWIKKTVPTVSDPVTSFGIITSAHLVGKGVKGQQSNKAKSKRAKSQEPRAKSKIPRATSQEPRATSHESSASSKGCWSCLLVQSSPPLYRFQGKTIWSPKRHLT